jgi:hypothetical protein
MEATLPRSGFPAACKPSNVIEVLLKRPLIRPGPKYGWSAGYASKGQSLSFHFDHLV